MGWKNSNLFGVASIISLIFALNHAAPNLSVADRQGDPPVNHYTVDNAQTSVVFSVSHFGLSYTYGRFNQCHGSFALQGGELAETGFRFTIDADSIDTNHDQRDARLRSSEFLDVKQFSKIKFATREITKVDGAYEVTGDVTIKGTTRSITIPIRLVGIGKGPHGKQRAGFFGQFSIKRSEFGMDAMNGQVGDNIAVTFSLKASVNESLSRQRVLIRSSLRPMPSQRLSRYQRSQLQWPVAPRAPESSWKPFFRYSSFAPHMRSSVSR